MEAWRRNWPSFRLTSFRFFVVPRHDIGAAVCQVADLVAVGAYTVAVLALLVAVIESEFRIGFVVADDARSPGDITLLDINAQWVAAEVGD